jgi:hypothetical protein
MISYLKEFDAYYHNNSLETKNYQNTFFKGNIISPVTGIVDVIYEKEIGIYIPRNSDHIIYSPITGILDDIKEKNGTWNRKTKIFEVPVIEPKTGSITFFIYGLINLTIEVEVGKSKYITNTINLDVNPHENNVLYQNQQIAEILIGSYLWIRLPKYAMTFLNVKPKDKLIGGQTILAQWQLHNPILLTVPHARCNYESKEHTCDNMALESALNLTEHLFPNKYAIIFPGNINRIAIDLNRKESRNTIFRKWVRKISLLVKQVYDIHSFPINSWVHKQNNHNNEYKCPYENPVLTNNIQNPNQAKMVILEDRCDLKAHMSYDLLNKFNNLNLSAALLLGSYGYNDIEDEMQYQNKEALLFEYSETLNKEELNKYNEVISDWINQQNLS